MGFVDAVDVVAGDQSVAMPFGNLAPRAPLHPAVSAGAEHRWLAGDHLALWQSARIGGHLHPIGGDALRLWTEAGGRATAGFGGLAEAGLDLGVAQIWRPRPVLAYDDGRWHEVPDAGRPALTAGFGLGVGYGRGPVTVLLDYRWFAQVPFLPAVLAGPSATLSAGIRWELP